MFWVLGLAMGTGQILGAWLGAHLAIGQGIKIIKPLVIIGAFFVAINLLLY